MTYLVTLGGRGDAMGMNTDTFVQDQKPKADVLFTIDDSCSMDTYQTNLANNFASFIGYAQSANVDWQIGVTTTDMDDGFPAQWPFPAKADGPKGKLLGDANNPKILTPTTPDVVNKFRAKVNVGSNGSGIEQGLEPSLRALTPPLSVSDNAGFIRPDANLAVVLVTDARDQGRQSASYYVNSFLNIKGFNKANMFTFNAIAGFNPKPPSTCTYDEGPDDGTYAAVVQQTNGIREEICTTTGRPPCRAWDRPRSGSAPRSSSPACRTWPSQWPRDRRREQHSGDQRRQHELALTRSPTRSCSRPPPPPDRGRQWRSPTSSAASRSPEEVPKPCDSPRPTRVGGVVVFSRHGHAPVPRCGPGTVTGSRFLLEHEGKRILVDCGLFQGRKE